MILLYDRILQGERTRIFLKLAFPRDGEESGDQFVINFVDFYDTIESEIIKKLSLLYTLRGCPGSQGCEVCRRYASSGDLNVV